MPQLDRYLYCIIPCAEERTFADAAPIGDVCGPVYTVPADGLAAVVSDSPLREYEGSRANMLAHERVQESVMKEYHLLPVRFGTVAAAASGAQDIRRLLLKRSQEFGGLLAAVEGKVELGLKALWRDERTPLEEIVAQNEGIRRLRNSLVGRSAEATYYERIRLGEMLKKALDRKRSAEAAGILAPLRRIAERTVENRTVMDRMIVNAAFLVDKAVEPEFDAQVGRLDAELGLRVAFKYVGPAPPYSFVNITVNWRDL